MRNLKTANSSDVKKINLQNTLRCILHHETISRPELARELFMSMPTVLQNVKDLSAMGLVREAGAYASRGGRKAVALEAVKDAKVSIGVNITKNHLNFVLINLAGESIGFERKKCTFSDEEAFYQALGESVKSFVEASGYPNDHLLGVGISLPGIVDEDGQVMVRSHVLNAQNVGIENFSRYIPYPCKLINDANAAGMAEVLGRELSGSMVYLSLSDSVGGSIFFEGELKTGDNFRAGEFGHQTLVYGGKPCYCGKKGCFDAYCSALVLSRHTNGSLESFFNLLKEGDADCRQIWEEYLGYLAVEINNIRMAFDCTVIVGGYVGAFLKEYRDELIGRLKDLDTFESDVSYLKVGRFRKDASAVGAALIYPDRYIKEL